MATSARPNGCREHWIAIGILGMVILLIYGDVAFMGYTLSPALFGSSLTRAVVIPPFGYKGRWLLYNIELDPLAAGGQNWPVSVLIGRMIRSGHLPLWNPYQGTGAPLAADPSWSTYFPFDLLYVFVGNPHWDYIWLLKLWVAGIFAYFLLRRMELSFSAAVGGGLAYALSGQFILSPFMNWTNVAILTPALLLVVMKSFDEPFRPGVVVGGALAFALAILGAHLEALLIQFSYVLLFVIFEAATRPGRRRMLGLSTWAITILLGTGLAAFFLLPVLQYSGVALLPHGRGTGLLSLSSGANNPLMYWVDLFVPYPYWVIQTYYHYVASPLRGFNFQGGFPGYIGACVLFLSLLPLYPILRQSVKFTNSKYYFLFQAKKDMLLASKYYFFFLAAAILVLMKIFGIPPINWIGSLPEFQFVYFPRYSGSVLAMSFSGAGAYGIELALRGKARNVSWPLFFLILAAILPSLLSTIPSPLSPSESYFSVSIGYFVLALYYAAIAAYVGMRGGEDVAEALVVVLVLELVSYLPRGLTGQYEIVRVCVLAGAALLVVVATRMKNPIWSTKSYHSLSKKWRRDQQVLASHTEKASPGIIRKNSPKRVMSRRNSMAIIFIAALVLQFSISGAAPSGIPQRYDPYTTPPYVKFLESNLGYQRVYSPDGLLFPDSAGVYALQNLGEFSALMPASFSAFSRANLDRGIPEGCPCFLGNAYTRKNSTLSAQIEIRDNIASYSLLGVKYFVTSYSYFGREISVQPENSSAYGLTPVGRGVVSSSFVTDLPFDELTLLIGTYGRGWTQSDVRIVIDSVPFNMSLHRESSIDGTSYRGSANYALKFSFESMPIRKKTTFLISISQSDTSKGNEVAILRWADVKSNTHLFPVPGSMNLSLGVIAPDHNLPLAFHDVNATVYENLRAFPRTFLIGNVTTASDENDAIQETRALSWGTRNTTVIEGMPQNEVAAINSAVGEPGVTSIQEYEPMSVSIRVLALRPSLLVLTDTYFPGWNAYLDGAPVPTYRSYGLVRGIFIPSGSHAVVFKYEPTSFKMGATISILSGVVLSFLICVSIYRRKRGT
jgi:hypothetical protein